MVQLSMPASLNEIEKRLWASADELRANSKLKSSEYSVPVLGLIFLCFADHRFSVADQELKAARENSGSSRRSGLSKTDYQARGVMYLPAPARFSALLDLPESADIRHGHQRLHARHRGGERGAARRPAQIRSCFPQCRT